jgi:imidazolonepropionase-like amidohydrolase
MVDYGMSPIDVLRAATSINARTFHLDILGEIKTGFIADLIAVQGNPAKDITQLKNVQLVLQSGKIIKH